MKKNGSKKSANTEQSEMLESVAVAAAPDTQPVERAALEGPGTDDIPTDGEGCEAVTVVIVSHDEKQAGLMAISVKKNLVGVNADIHIVPGPDLKDTLAETLAEHLPHCQTERIILMTDGMVILNPVTLSDVGMVKAIKDGGIASFNTFTPVLMHKSALETLLKEAVADDKPYIDIIDTYFRGTLPEGYRPMVLGEWHSDHWLLPVISRNPPIEKLQAFAKWKKFMIVGSQSWSNDLVKFLEERFAE